MSMLRSATYLALLGGLFVGTGCMVEGDDVTGDDVVVEDDPTSEVGQAIGGVCPPFMCNGATMATPFHELNEKGLENLEGYTLLGLESAGLMYSVDVVGGQLKATRPLFPTIQGMGVLNKVLKIKHRSGKLFLVRIDAVHNNVAYWPHVPGAGTTWAYRMTYRDAASNPDSPWSPLCQNAADWIGEYDTLGQPKWSVVLFEGDRWDAITKQPKAFSKEWFNVGCAGHVLGKLHMTHHSFVGASVPGYANSVEERMAMVNMYTSNVCGDGTPFTINGTPLSWSDWHVWSPNYYIDPKLEARWDAHGAICLETHRLEGTTDPDAINEFGPDIEAAIAGHCTRPPKCSDLGQDMDPTKLEGALFVSANPPP